MKTREDIEEEIKILEGDDRLSQPMATIDINAPLALTQLSLEMKISALKWVLKDKE